MSVIHFPSQKRPSRRSHDSEPVEEFDAPLFWFWLLCVLACVAFYGLVALVVRMIWSAIT